VFGYIYSECGLNYVIVFLIVNKLKTMYLKHLSFIFSFTAKTAPFFFYLLIGILFINNQKLDVFMKCTFKYFNILPFCCFVRSYI